VLNEGNEGKHLKQISKHAETAGHFEYLYALENFDIWYAQALNVNLHDIGEYEKDWD